MAESLHQHTKAIIRSDALEAHAKKMIYCWILQIFPVWNYSAIWV